MAEHSSYVLSCKNRSALPRPSQFGPVNSGHSGSRENIGNMFTSVTIDQFYMSLDWGLTLQKNIKWGYNLNVKIVGEDSIKLIRQYPLELEISVPTLTVGYWSMVAAEVINQAMIQLMRTAMGAIDIIRVDRFYPTDPVDALWETNFYWADIVPNVEIEYQIDLLCNNSDMLLSVAPYLMRPRLNGPPYPAYPDLRDPIRAGTPARLFWEDRLTFEGAGNLLVGTSINPYMDETFTYDCTVPVKTARGIEVRAINMPIPEVNFVGSGVQALNRGDLNGEDMESLSVLAYWFLNAPPAALKKPNGLYTPAGGYTKQYPKNELYAEHVPPLPVVYRGTTDGTQINLYPLPGINEPEIVTYSTQVTKRKLLYQMQDWSMDNVKFEVFLRSAFMDVLEAYQQPREASQLGIKLYTLQLNR
jgi:hypothetical protein